MHVKAWAASSLKHPFPPQVNIIPIIAKSDAISKSELAKFKLKITSELVNNGVQIYHFPTDDESVAEINSSMNVRLATQATCGYFN